MDRKTVFIVIALMAAEITSTFEGTMVLSGLPAWIAIHKDPVSVGWLVTSYLLMAASAAAICGRLGDIFGRKKVLLIVLGCCVGGSVVSAVSSSLGWMIAGRVLQGFAGAILPLCYGLAREHLPDSFVSTAVGLIVTCAVVGGGAGYLLGGILTDQFGPQSIFWASALVGLGSSVAVVFMLPSSERKVATNKIDLIGGVLFAPAIALLLFALGEGSNGAGSTTMAITTAAAGAAMLCAWIWHELRAPDPLIDVRLFIDRNVLIANLVLACLAIGAFQFGQLMTILMQQPVWTGVGLGLSATMVGALRLPTIATGGLASTLSGWACGRYGGRVPILVGTILLAGALAFVTIDHSSAFILVAGSLITTMGVSIVYAGVPNVIIAAVPADRTSETTGLMAVVRAVSRAIGAQLLMLVLARSTVRNEMGQVFPDDRAFTTVLFFMTALAVLAIALTLLLPRGRQTANESALTPRGRLTSWADGR